MESPDGTRGLNWRDGRWIPWSEIEITQKTSGGPGGQHANRSATAIDLRWKPENSCAFSPEEMQELVAHLSSRLDGHGKLRILASDERSAARNRELALERLAQMVQEGLRPRRTRKPTRPTRSSDEKRLLEKKQRARLKKDRSRKFPDDG